MAMWQAYRRLPRAVTDDGPTTAPVGEPFPAADKLYASAIGRRRVGRDFAWVRSTASIACDEVVPVFRGGHYDGDAA